MIARVLFTAAATACLTGAGPAAAITVRWADYGALPTGAPAPGIVGAPDAVIQSPGAWQAAKFDSARSYASLAATIGVPEEDLATYQVLAWEGNGGGPAASGGWESANWGFSANGVGVISTFNELTGTGSDPTVLFKTGSINATQYAGLFGASRPDVLVWSWLLVRLPAGIDALSPTFVVDHAAVGGGLGLGEGTPDPDAIGVLAAVPEPGTWAMLSIGLAVVTGLARRQRPLPGRRMS